MGRAQRQANPLIDYMAAAAFLAALAAVTRCAAVAAEAELETPAVEVVGTTPLPALGTPRDQVPANVQVLTEKNSTPQHPFTAADSLAGNIAGITTNESQSNPFQPNVNFRGFTASPLLGTPQGLSVFQDGVRINEAFGDTVNWDLLPQSAIASITLVPGSNPVFGLNTLGGALAIQTKRGLHYPGLVAQGYGGAFGRRTAEIEWGGHRRNLDYFVSGNGLDEDGWREHSPSRVRQLFAKGGYQDEINDAELSLTGADNTLQGVQALPLSMLDHPEQAYTWPDRTANRLTFLATRGSRAVGETGLVSANLYYRWLKTDTFSSNVNDACATSACAFSAFNNTTRIEQTGNGGSVQLTLLKNLGSRKNQFTLGASLDHGDTEFQGASQDAVFTADRGTVGIAPFHTDTRVSARNDYYGVYFTDTLSVTRSLHATVAGRYNRAHLVIADASGLSPALNGSHRFSRFNPAVGLTYSPTTASNLYAGYNEGMRAPTPVELTCADPAAPCQLPNEFLADPPLKPVVSRTWEAGWRRSWSRRLHTSVAAFRTDLADDIQFIGSSGGMNAGYFQNVGKTRRQGLEFALQSQFEHIDLALRYSLVEATFESAFAVSSPNNSSSDSLGEIRVNPGDRIPSVPRHALKLQINYTPVQGFVLGTIVTAYSPQYARGDENNQDRTGAVPGYSRVDLRARYQLSKDWQLFALVDNLFDRRYATFGTLGSNFFTGPGNSFAPLNATPEQFRSPGAPRGIWVGLRYEIGRGAKTD